MIDLEVEQPVTKLNTSLDHLIANEECLVLRRWWLVDDWHLLRFGNLPVSKKRKYFEAKIKT